MTLITIKIDGETSEERIFESIKIICNEHFQKFELEVSGKEKTLRHITK